MVIKLTEKHLKHSANNNVFLYQVIGMFIVFSSHSLIFS